jgi:hypothetical protein
MKPAFRLLDRHIWSRLTAKHANYWNFPEDGYDAIRNEAHDSPAHPPLMLDGRAREK